MTQPADSPADDEARRRLSVPWLIAWVVAVVVVVVVTLVLTSGHAGDGDDEPAAGGTAGTAATTSATTSGTTSAGGGYDLSTPENAARSFASAAAAGSGDTLLTLACVGHVSCVHEHATDLGAAQLDDARAVIRDNAPELAHHLRGVEFSPAVDGAVPGAKDVPYRTPAMAADARLTLTFVRSGDDWLYYGPAGG